MNNEIANAVIENSPVLLRHVNQFGGLISLDRKQEYIDAGVHSAETCEFFEKNPFGKTDKYEWETRRVDYIVNVHVNKVA
jgi:hypothetical protein